MRTIVILLAFLLCTGFSGNGRFPKAPLPSEAGKAIAAVRGLLRPLYELRGVLFQTRLELVAMQGGPAARAAYAEWLNMPAADAGWIAERLETLRSLEGKKRDKLVVSAAQFLGGPLEQDAVKRSLRELARADILKAGEPPPVDEPVLLAAASDAAARKSLTGRLEAVPRILAQFKNLPEQTKGVTTSAGAAFAKMRKGDAGDLATAALVLTILLPAVVEDVQGVPALLKSIAKDGAAIAAALPKLQEKLAGVAPDAAATLAGAASLGNLDGLLPTAEAFSGLGPLLGVQ